MNKIVKYISRNRSHIALKPIGMTLHETATPGATAENEFSYYNGNDVKASAHGFLDWTDTFIQTIPFSEKAWHACEPANSMFIGIEMCHPSAHDASKFNIIYLNAVQLFAETFINTLKIDKVTKDNLMSHDEVRLKWGNTSHVDPTAYFKEYGKSMDGFRNDVQYRINQIIGGNTMTIDQAKAIIQQHCKFDNPDAVFNHLLSKADAYEYGSDLIVKWAKSY